jgi:hypothetical protein
MHALLIEWSDSILDTPTLVQLGYDGGMDVTIPPVAGSTGDNDASWFLDKIEEQGPKVGDDPPLWTQTQSWNRLEKRQQAVHKTPLTNARGVHANNDDSYGEDQSLMTQSQHHLESGGQHAVQNDGRGVVAKNDCEDPDNISEQEGSGDSAQGFSAYFASAMELQESTDALFNEITDPDTVTMNDIRMSLCKKYGFKLGRHEKALVERRLIALINANSTFTTSKDSVVATEYATDSARQRPIAQPRLRPGNISSSRMTQTLRASSTPLVARSKRLVLPSVPRRAMRFQQSGQTARRLTSRQPTATTTSRSLGRCCHWSSSMQKTNAVTCQRRNTLSGPIRTRPSARLARVQFLSRSLL